MTAKVQLFLQSDTYLQRLAGGWGACLAQVAHIAQSQRQVFVVCLLRISNILMSPSRGARG
jgi:hypothetical protein